MFSICGDVHALYNYVDVHTLYYYGDVYVFYMAMYMFSIRRCICFLYGDVYVLYMAMHKIIGDLHDDYGFSQHGYVYGCHCMHYAYLYCCYVCIFYMVNGYKIHTAMYLHKTHVYYLKTYICFIYVGIHVLGLIGNLFVLL